MKILVSLVLPVFFFSGLGFSQTPEWRQYTSGRIVKAFAENGNVLFVATSGGILMLGKTSGERNFLTRANSGLPATDVSSLLVDSKGNLWAGTARAGLARFSLGTWTVFDVSNSPIPGNFVSALAEDSAGNIWVGTSPISGYNSSTGGGLARFDGGALWSVWRISNSPLPDSTVRDIEIDSAGNAWLATRGGVVRFDGSSGWTVYRTGNSQLPQDNALGVEFDAAGRLWAATTSTGSNRLSRWESDTLWTVFQLPQVHQFLFSLGTCLSYDRTRDAFWLGSDEGLFSFDGDSAWTLWDTAKTALPFPRINSIYADAQGTVWGGLVNSGFQGEGFFQFDGDSVFAFHDPSNSGLLHNRVVSLTSQNDGTMWVLTDGIGVLKFDRKSDWDTLRPLNGGIWQGIANAIALDNTGRPWVGTQFDGILRWEGGSTWRDYLPSLGASSVAALSNGRVYAATGSGLARFNSYDTLFMLYDTANSKFQRLGILSLLADKADNLWIGTDDSGLIKLAPDSSWTAVRAFNDSLNPPFDAIEALTLDSAGFLWAFATYYGVARINTLNQAVGPVYNEKNSPLPRAGVTCLAADGTGNLWVGTGTGLFKLNPSGQWANFTVANSGLADNSIQSLSVDVDGNLWIGTYYGGVSVFGENGILIAAEQAGAAAGPAMSLSVFPNPLRGGALLTYSLPRAGAVRLSVYDAAGRAVARLFHGARAAGRGRLAWDGRGAAAGVYFVSMTCGRYSIVKKLIVLK